jgi:ATP-dependent helicase HrpB
LGAGGRSKGLSLAEMAALAYPDRIGLRRKGDAPRWVLSGGKGAAMACGIALSGARLIVATDLDGDAREATVRQAVAISEAEVRGLYADRIRLGRGLRMVAARRAGCCRGGRNGWGRWCWTTGIGMHRLRRLALAALDGVRLLGLPWTPAARRLRARARLARGEGWPEVEDPGPAGQRRGLALAASVRLKTEADLRGWTLCPRLQA